MTLHSTSVPTSHRIPCRQIVSIPHCVTSAFRISAYPQSVCASAASSSFTLVFFIASLCGLPCFFIVALCPSQNARHCHCLTSSPHFYDSFSLHDSLIVAPFVYQVQDLIYRSRIHCPFRTRLLQKHHKAHNGDRAYMAAETSSSSEDSIHPLTEARCPRRKRFTW